MAVRDYRELVTWQKAMDLVEAVYKESRGFPREEQFGLTSQIRRAAVAIPSNIAEGQGRKFTKEFVYHLSVALGSLCEMETQLLIALRLNYVNEETYQTLSEGAAEVGRLLNGLIHSLSAR